MTSPTNPGSDYGGGAACGATISAHTNRLPPRRGALFPRMIPKCTNDSALTTAEIATPMRSTANPDSYHVAMRTDAATI